MRVCMTVAGAVPGAAAAPLQQELDSRPSRTLEEARRMVRGDAGISAHDAESTRCGSLLQ